MASTPDSTSLALRVATAAGMTEAELCAHLDAGASIRVLAPSDRVVTIATTTCGNFVVALGDSEADCRARAAAVLQGPVVVTLTDDETEEDVADPADLNFSCIVGSSSSLRGFLAVAAGAYPTDLAHVGLN